MRLIRWMSNVTLRDRTPSAELRGSLDIEGISEVLCTGRLRWLGYMERMGVDNWVKRCTNVIIDGRKPRGRLRKTWGEVLCNVLKIKGFNR